MTESAKPKEIFFHVMSVLNSHKKDLKKKIKRNNTDSLGEIEVFCPKCKRDNLIPDSPDYSSLKCLDCKTVFNIPYYLDQKTTKFSRIENKNKLEVA